MTDIAGLLIPVGGAVALAVQALFLRVATRGHRVTDVLFVVLLVNVSLVVPLSVLYEAPDYGLTATSVGAFVAAGLLGTVLGRLALFVGIQRVGASRAEPLKGSTPLFAAGAAVLVLGERLTGPHLLGIVLIVAGIAVISWTQAHEPDSRTVGSVRGLAFPLFAALLFAIEPVFAKIGFDAGTPFLVGLAVKTVAAAVGLSVYLRYVDRLPTLRDLRHDRLPWYVAAGLANTAFILALYASLSIAPVSYVVPIIQSSPLFVVVLSYVFLQDLERITVKLAIGTCIVVAGGVLVAVYG